MHVLQLCIIHVCTFTQKFCTCRIMRMELVILRILIILRTLIIGTILVQTVSIRHANLRMIKFMCTTHPIQDVVSHFCSSKIYAAAMNFVELYLTFQYTPTSIFDLWRRLCTLALGLVILSKQFLGPQNLQIPENYFLKGAGRLPTGWAIF